MQAPADKIAEPLGRGRQGHVPQDAQVHAAGRDIKGCAQLPQTAAVQLPVDELLRDSGHAEADGRQVYQQASGAQLDLRVQMQTVLQEILSKNSREDAFRSSRISGNWAISSRE